MIKGCLLTKLLGAKCGLNNNVYIVFGEETNTIIEKDC